MRALKDLDKGTVSARCVERGDGADSGVGHDVRVLLDRVVHGPAVQLPLRVGEVHWGDYGREEYCEEGPRHVSSRLVSSRVVSLADVRLLCRRYFINDHIKALKEHQATGGSTKSVAGAATVSSAEGVSS